VKLDDPNIIFHDQHIHTFLINQDLKQEEKPSASWSFRHGLASAAKWASSSGGNTFCHITEDRQLPAGEVLITVITDKTARQLAHLVAKTKGA